MLKIYNIKEKTEYIKEVATLNQLEWGKIITNEDEFENKINNKVEKIVSNLDNHNFCILVLLDGKELVGHISLFPTDSEERHDLTPWYATMYVKKEYRGKGYSKILNNAILEEARKRGFKKIYLKSDLKNYYEKFGAIYMYKLNNGESLYYIDLKGE